MFDMYQRYILFGFKPKKLYMSTNFMGNWDFNDQNTLNLSKNVSFEVLFN